MQSPFTKPASIELFPINASHIAELRVISQQTFTETFAHLNTEENMHRYVSENLNPEVLLHQVNHPGSRFFMAVSGKDALGYLKVNFAGAQTELQDPHALEIERIYVLKSHQHSGVGRMLLQKALNLARDARLHYVWLGVWERNDRAIAFYRMHGFEAFDKHVFTLGDDAQTDILMKLTLNGS